MCAQLCLTLCDPMDCSPPGSSWPWDFPGKNTCGLPLPSPGESSQSRNQTHVYCISFIGRQILYHYRYLGSPINHSNITQRSILLFPQMSVDSPQKGFSGLQENACFCLWSLSNSHISTRLTDKDSPSHYLVSQGLWTLL